MYMLLKTGNCIHVISVRIMKCYLVWLRYSMDSIESTAESDLN